MLTSMSSTTNTMNMTITTSPATTNMTPDILIYALPSSISFLGIIAIIIGIILIPLIIRNNRRKMQYSISNNDNSSSEQPSGTTGGILEGGQSIMDTINSSGPSQTAPGDEIERFANHLYDDLINYTSQASHTDSECSQVNHKTSIEVGISESDVKKTDNLRKDEDDSGAHTYAVLEEAVPPVPERTYRLNTNGKKRPEKEEHNCAIGHPSQNNGLNDKVNNHPSYVDIAYHPKDRKIKELPQYTLNTSNSDGHKDIKRGVDNVDSPNQHTYAVLEGPVQISPFKRHKTQSVGVRKIQSPTVAKRLSDTPHVYDTLIEKVKQTTVSTRTDEDPSVHQYAVLEGPTPPIGPHSGQVTKQVRKDSFKLSTNEPAPIGYDKLPPRNKDNNNGLQKNEDSLSAVINKSSTLTAGYDRLEPKAVTAGADNQVDMGHTYATLTPEEESVKSKKGKKRSKKKQKQKHMSNQTDDSHIYDILDSQTEINSRAVRNEHKVLPPVPPRVSTASSNTSSSISHSVSAPHKRKISHSFSSRMLSDVTEGRKRALTVFTAASDTNLHKIHPDAEAHIYDTIEVSPAFPVSKRKQRRSGKRYRWLHLKERLERQTSLEILGSPTDTDLISSHVTKTDAKAEPGPLTQSASLGNIMSEAVESKLESSTNYTSLDMRQVYAQVGPYLPGKEDSKQHKPDDEKDSEYSHLQHH